MAEVNIRRAVRFLFTDDAKPESRIERAHRLGTVLPLTDLRLPNCIGKIIRLFEHFVGRFEILFKMMPRGTKRRTDISKALQFLIARETSVVL